MPLYVEARLPAESKTWRELVLVPLADVHIGAREFDERLFLKKIEWIAAAPNRFAVINGDLLNVAVRRSKSDIYSETMRPRDAKRWAVRALQPIADRILSATTGNHEERMSREMDVDLIEEIAEELGVPFDRAGCVVKVAFGPGDGHLKRMVYTIYHTHGATGSRRPGGKLNHMEDLSNAWEGVDVFISGHSHAKIVYKERKLVVDARNGKISQREVLHVNNSAFLGWGGYSERKGYRPSSLGPPHIILRGDAKEALAVA